MSAQLAQVVHVPLHSSNMSPEPIPRRSRRSTRVPLRVVIEVQDAAESLPGETILVNLHGALISTSAQLNVGMRISVYVYLTDKRAKARVVYIDPEKGYKAPIWRARPWDMTALDLGDLAELFVTNVLNGTVAANGDVVNRTITGEMEI